MKKSLNLCAAFLFTMLINTGCVLFIGAVTATVIYFTGDEKTVSAEAILERPADLVYAAILDEIEDDKGIEVEDEDYGKMTITATRGDRLATCVVKVLESKKSSLRVDAAAGNEKQEEEYQMAVDIVVRVCKNLGIEYELVEREQKAKDADK